jgi:hypothetical protein
MNRIHAKNSHHQILLNQNPCGRVAYCESCAVIELEVGPVSLRIHADDLSLFSELIQASETRLRHYQMQKEKFDQEMIHLGEIH